MTCKRPSEIDLAVLSLLPSRAIGRETQRVSARAFNRTRTPDGARDYRRKIAWLQRHGGWELLSDEGQMTLRERAAEQGR